MAEPAIRIENLTVTHGRHPAVHHLSGSVAAGSLTAVIGPNGAGKTTLLRAIAGLHPLSGGRITLSGRVALLPQAAAVDRAFPIACRDVVLFGLWQRIGAFARVQAADMARAEEALAAVGLAGFARPDAQGVWRGFDVDYCRAVAIAIFNDANRVRFVPTTAQQRFPAIQSGEVDVLIRNTTWTLTRDVSLGLDFTGINFYDGQGFMVRTSLGVRRASELNGATICVQPGTTTERNLTDWARANRIQFTPVVIERLEEVVQAYLAGRCDAYTVDVSALAAGRLSLSNPDDYVILPEVISKEPLGPWVRQGDDQWFDIVRWTIYALIEAEELGAEAAAQHYFRKPAARLTPAEAARLAVLLPAPKRYGARLGSGYLESRTQTILARMGAVRVP